MGYDGKIRIKATLEDKEYDKKVENLNKKIETEQEKNKNITKEINKQTEALAKKEREYSKTVESIASLQSKLNSSRSETEKGLLQGNINAQKEKLTEVSTEKEKIQRLLDKENAKQQQINNKIDDYKSKIDSINLQRHQKETKELTGKVNKIANTVKRWGLTLLSVGTAYSLITRASNAYISSNSTLQNQLNSLWNVLGTLLGPAIEFVVNLLSKAIGYLDVFIKALTGVSIIAKANARALKKQAKAQKEVNKEIADFDEIRKVNDETSGSVDTGSISTFDTPELNPEIVEKLQELAKWLQDNWFWLEKVGIALGAVFGASVVAGWLENIGLLLGGKSKGILGLSSILKTLATIGVIAIGVSILYTALTGRDLIKDLKEIAQGYKDLKDAQEAYDNIQDASYSGTERLIDAYNKAKDTIGVTEERIKSYANALLNTIGINNKHNKEILDEISLVERAVGLTKEHQEALNKNNRETELAIDALRNLAKEKGFDEETTNNLTDALSQYIENLKLQQTWLGIGSDEMKENKQKVKDLQAELENISKGDYKIKTTLEAPNTTTFKNSLNKLFGATGTALAAVGFNNIKIPKLAKGGITTGVTHAVIGDNYGGQEAVLPLDDATMSRLATAITSAMPNNNGNNIIYVQLNGRTLQKEIQKADKEFNFERNR